MTASVFIVDDSDPLREMVEEYLALEPDLEVCGSAASAEEALARLTAHCCDIALIDVSMPGMNGIELAQRLSVAVPGLPCVMYSAHAEEVYVRRAREAGAAGYVMKGNPADLLVAVRRVLNGEDSFGQAIG